MEIGVVGGTGDEGFGLVLRLARAGHIVVIGSRSEERGRQAAERAREILGGDIPVDGTTNETCAAGAELVFVTVPYAGQAEIYRSIRRHLEGRVVVDTTTPLATAVGGRPWQVVRPWHGSAAEQAEAVLGRGTVRLVAGFHTVSAEQLQDVERPMEGDVLLCGADAEAKAQVGALVEDIPDLRWVDAGELATARLIEPLTALMVSVNRRYGIKDAGIALTGRKGWGKPDA